MASGALLFPTRKKCNEWPLALYLCRGGLWKTFIWNESVKNLGGMSSVPLSFLVLRLRAAFSLIRVEFTVVHLF